MPKPAIDFGKQALTLMRDVQQNKANIKELREELKALRKELQDLVLVVKSSRSRWNEPPSTNGTSARS